MQINTAGFGIRLRDARRHKKLSARWICDFINGYMCPLGYKPIGVKTYYAWEYIGTHREEKNGRSFPHPLVYRLICIVLGITLYWLLYGDLNGRVVRYSNQLPNSKQIEQTAAVTESDPLSQEIGRLKHKINPAQRNALLAFLRTL